MRFRLIRGFVVFPVLPALKTPTRFVLLIGEFKLPADYNSPRRWYVL